MEIILLGLFAFFAGFVDAVAGGGGLIQLPALFAVLPQTLPADILGTNKFAAIAGTFNAACRFVRKVPLRYRAVGIAAVAAFLFSFLGARLATQLPVQFMKPLALVMLVAVALYMLLNKEMGLVHAPRLTGRTEALAALSMGTVIGVWDGLLGPGTGSFLIFGFIRIFGFDFLAASAAAKIVNVATNLAALSYFGFTGHILYSLAVPMAICNVAGSWCGSHMAIKKGSGFIRGLFLCILSILIMKFGYDTLFAGK